MVRFLVSVTMSPSSESIVFCKEGEGRDAQSFWVTDPLSSTMVPSTTFSRRSTLSSAEADMWDCRWRMRDLPRLRLESPFLEVRLMERARRFFPQMLLGRGMCLGAPSQFLVSNSTIMKTILTFCFAFMLRLNLFHFRHTRVSVRRTFRARRPLEMISSRPVSRRLCPWMTSPAAASRSLQNVKISSS